MSYFDDASLVLIPSGYKNQKIYSVKPLDGSGDLTFTRASNATRVASNGLIEKVRTNLALYSEDFADATWAKINSASATGNTAVAPNGTTTADTITGGGSSSTSRVRQSFAFVAGAEYAVSIYVKANNSLTGRLATLNGGGTTRTSVTFTNTSGVVAISGSTGGGVTDIEDVGSGWYRISHQIVINDQTTLDFFPDISGTNLSWYVWGAMIETGVLTPYIGPTTSAAVSVGPVSGLPRLDYLNSSCPRLLLEPQRTNLALWSENFDNAAWNKTASTTITANANVSPSGYQDADTYTTTASGTGSQIYRVISVSGTTQTLSIFIKYLSGSGTNLRFSIGSVESLGVNLTFSNSGATLTGVKGSSVNTLNIENYGNNWFRVSISVAYASATAEFNLFRPTGTGTDAYAIWGAQLEASTAYVTSYIPTLGTSVTRVADAASKTSISSLIGQTEGTIFAEIYPEEFVNGSYIGISDGANIANRIIFGFESGSANSGTLEVFGASGLTGSGTYTRGQRMKVAIGYKSGSSALYVNGNLVDSKTTTFTATFTKFGFDSYAGTQNFVGKCSQVLISKTRLTNAQLAELTTI